jgi:intracellular septation protein
MKGAEKHILRPFPIAVRSSGSWQLADRRRRRLGMNKPSYPHDGMHRQPQHGRESQSLSPANGYGDDLEGFSFRKALPRLSTELGPPLIFFAATKFWDIYIGTVVMVVTATAAVFISRRREGRWPIIPVFGVVLSLVLAAIMLTAREPYFIMVRPTIYNGIGAVALAITTWRDWLPLRDIFGEGLKSSDKAWRQVSLGLVGFLVFLAILNEIVWRTFGQDVWVSFKAFGIPALDGLFALFAWRRLKRGRLILAAQAKD